MKDHSDEFKADAVALYESIPGATYKSVAADLGINRATLREWVLRDRERRGTTTSAGAGRTPARAGTIGPPSCWWAAISRSR
ncbi:transposase [Streptomyces sp. NPDC058632]